MSMQGPMGNLPSVMGHNFSRVPQATIPRSSFDRSHGHKTTMRAGILVPVFVDDVLPGDTFNLKATMFGRLLTPIVPVMDNLYLESFFFFVPNRLIWDNWEKFNGAQTNPGDSTSFLMPRFATNTGTVGTSQLLDYMGIPSNINFAGAGAFPYVTSLPWRAYLLIWNEWFRDQNLQNSQTVPTGDGPDSLSVTACLGRGKRHDYFTSSLPWPQKGPSVSIPLGTAAPITSNSAGTGSNKQIVVKGDTSGYLNREQIGAAGTPIYAAGGGSWTANEGLVWPVSTDAAYNYADLSAAAAATINQLRQSFQLQKLYERDARGGTRYTEIIRAHFGVVSPDMRLQRPEYLGGGSSPINISPIPQTSATGATGTPQGNLAAIGVFSSGSNGFVKSFTEHGWIIGLVNIRADLTYCQGIERMWSRQTRADHYWPALSHIGEQAVLQQEIYATGVVAADTGVWGYQERYAEYRYKPSRLSGQMRTYAAVSPNYSIWSLSVPFTSAPALNAAFIADSAAAAVDKVIAVNTFTDQFLVDIYFKLHTARPMPTYSVPGLIDHF